MINKRQAGSDAHNPCEMCAIRNISVCRALEPSELDRLDAIVTRTKLAAGQMVFSEEDSADSLFNVTDGVVRIYKQMMDGRRQITGFLFPGDFLGTALQDRYIYSAEAVTPVSLCRFPRRQLERLSDEIPRFEKALLQSASNELAAAQEQMMLLGRKTAKERVATFLLMLYQRALRRGAFGDLILELPITRGDIADFLGLSLETVSRTFTQLKNERLISIPHIEKVEIADQSGMEDLSGVVVEDAAIERASL